MATESVPRRTTHLVFTQKGVQIRCGRCLQLASPGRNPTEAWANWRAEGHDTLEHKGIRVVEKVVERVVEKRVEVPVERVVVQERRIYLCHQCNKTFDEGEDFEAHREQCAALLDQKVRAMLQRRIEQLGLQDRL